MAPYMPATFLGQQSRARDTAPGNLQEDQLLVALHRVDRPGYVGQGQTHEVRAFGAHQVSATQAVSSLVVGGFTCV